MRRPRSPLGPPPRRTSHSHGAATTATHSPRTNQSGAASARPAAAQPDPDQVTIETVEMADGIYMLKGAGGNIGVYTGLILTTENVVRGAGVVEVLVGDGRA